MTGGVAVIVPGDCEGDFRQLFNATCRISAIAGVAFPHIKLPLYLLRSLQPALLLFSEFTNVLDSAFRSTGAHLWSG